MCVFVYVCVREPPSQQKTRMTLGAPDRNVTGKEKKKRDEEIKKERKGRRGAEKRQMGQREEEEEKRGRKLWGLGQTHAVLLTVSIHHTHTHQYTLGSLCLCTNRHARTPKGKLSLSASSQL